MPCEQATPESVVRDYTMEAKRKHEEGLCLLEKMYSGDELSTMDRCKLDRILRGWEI